MVQRLGVSVLLAFTVASVAVSQPPARLPDFSFETLAGRRFRRADLGARPVILKFGPSW